jgi:hypothetical protein
VREGDEVTAPRLAFQGSMLKGRQLDHAFACAVWRGGAPLATAKFADWDADGEKRRDFAWG